MSLSKITAKYNCMVSGEKRMQPCAGCLSPKGCASTTMQYKETEDMTEEKAVLKVNADGDVLSCAKGAEPADCGFSGGKVCGKCGALAVTSKATDVDDEIDDEEEKGMVRSMPPVTDDQDEKPAYGGMHSDDDVAALRKRRAAARERRLTAMGVKSDDLDEGAFLCALERKMHPGTGDVCAACPGGCAPEKDLPTILEIEGIAEEMFAGKVLDSGYGDAADLFLVDVERKDGRIVEVLFDGTTAEVQGWSLLADGVLSQKSAAEGVDVIDMDQAAQLALKSVQGEFISVDADVFEGLDAWAVEIDGLDGKSYDVYVALNGEVLGYDAYDAEEAEAIEAEAAEIALKRAYSDPERERMAGKGQAMEDGSFPIRDEEDLRNAIVAHGRAKDIEAAKAHIIKRAEDLGLEELVPKSWMGADDEADDDEKSAEVEAEEKTDADDDDADDDDDDDTEEKAAVDDEFLASLMEFEVLAAEADLDD